MNPYIPNQPETQEEAAQQFQAKVKVPGRGSLSVQFRPGEGWFLMGGRGNGRGATSTIPYNSLGSAVEEAYELMTGFLSPEAPKDRQKYNLGYTRPDR